MRNMTEKEINLKLIIVLGRMTKSMDKAFTPEIYKSGITMTQFGVLEALFHKGPLTVNEIIEATLSSSGNMGVVIRNLEKAGLVKKAVSEQDKRSRKISLTDKGSELIAALFPEHVKDIMKAFKGLDISEKSTLIELIKKLGKSIGEY
jgi:MarR family 2-MHQ and catechol resistance regulon transcriptional repressor